MDNKSDTASIREVYQIATRIETKLDATSDAIDRRFSNLEQRVANIEGRSAIIAIAWSSVVSLMSVLLTQLLTRK